MEHARYMYFMKKLKENIEPNIDFKDNNTDKIASSLIPRFMVERYCDIVALK